MMSRIAQHEGSWEYNNSLYEARLDSQKKALSRRTITNGFALTQYDSPFALKPHDFWAYLRIGFQTDENSSKVTKRFVTSTKQPCIKNNKGAFIKTQSCTRLRPGVSSFTIFNINAKWLISRLWVGFSLLIRRP